MTDKQIIIDGVDIRLFRTPVEVMHYLQQGDLYVVTKELLEQLQAKEQECERLEEEIKNKAEDLERHQNHLYELGQTILSLDKQLDQLKKENEELRQEIRLIHDDCKGCSTCFNALESARIYCVENQKLKTLTEIKEIAKSVTDCGSKCETCEADGYCADCEDKILKQILQKISECEVNNG